jgi:hypothetical protein
MADMLGEIIGFAVGIAVSPILIATVLSLVFGVAFVGDAIEILFRRALLSGRRGWVPMAPEPLSASRWGTSAAVSTRSVGA